MDRWKLKEVKDVWEYHGIKEVDCGSYDNGLVTKEICLLWKSNRGISDTEIIRLVTEVLKKIKKLEKKKKEKNP